MPFYHLVATKKNFTCGFETDDEGYITKAAPIIKKFIGQHLNMLLRWVGDNELTKIGENYTAITGKSMDNWLGLERKK